MKHRGSPAFRTWCRQTWCSLRHAGHLLDCGYDPDCDGNHVCTSCGWTGQ